MLIYSVSAQSVILTTTHEGTPYSTEGSNKNDVVWMWKIGSKEKIERNALGWVRRKRMRLGYQTKKVINYFYAFETSRTRTKYHEFKLELARLKLIFYDSWKN